MQQKSKIQGPPPGLGANNASRNSNSGATGELEVCRYFMLGTCYRTDCRYAHVDSKSVECRYWQMGHCNKGQLCPFAHEQIPVHDQEETVVQEERDTRIEYDSKDFPALGADFGPKLDFWGPTASFSSMAINNKPAQSASRPKMPQNSPKSNNYGSRERVDAQWVDTGAAISSRYLQERDQAIQASLERNRLCQQYLCLTQSDQCLSVREQGCSTHIVSRGSSCFCTFNRAA